jgi:hypothetical protein
MVGAQEQRPNICFGKEVLPDGSKARNPEQLKAWQAKCELARYGHFGAMGGKDEREIARSGWFTKVGMNTGLAFARCFTNKFFLAGRFCAPK